MEEKKNEIILFENQGVKLEVNLKEDTVWLTQAQMGILFDVKQSTLSEHINNIFKEGELDEKTSIGISDNSNLYFGGMIMKIVKIILSIVTMLFALLGLLRVISFDIANPIMFLALATLFVLRSIEYKKDRDNSGFILTIFTAIFLYIVVIYNVFIG